MNNVDKQYLDLLKDIIENGTEKETRAGKVKSVFGRMMRFNLKEGLPLLTTKKVYTKGIIHELLWFLKGDTNIKYLVDNNVNIWNDDAYRYYKNIIERHNKLCENPTMFVSYKRERLPIVSKEEFIEKIKNNEGVWVILDEHAWLMSYTPNCWEYEYKFGDLGPVYGKQWRNQFGKDQIQNIINTLKTNPDDRRMLCVAWNNADIDNMALPPCHVMFQFYTRELENGRRELSCMWTQRSADSGLGLPFNLLSYSILTHIIAEICDMEVGEIICSLGDCHIYLNQLEGLTEQLSRDPYKYDLPKLSFTRKITDIDDVHYEDISIENYQSYDKIKLPLSVGI